MARHWPTPWQQLFFRSEPLVPGMWRWPTHQSTWSAGWLWHVRPRIAAVCCHHWFTEGQLSFNIMCRSRLYRTDPLLLFYSPEVKAFGTPVVSTRRTLDITAEIVLRSRLQSCVVPGDVGVQSRCHDLQKKKEFLCKLWNTIIISVSWTQRVSLHSRVGSVWFRWLCVL